MAQDVEFELVFATRLTTGPFVRQPPADHWQLPRRIVRIA